jgi:hypothetical protein
MRTRILVKASIVINTKGYEADMEADDVEDAVRNVLTVKFDDLGADLMDELSHYEKSDEPDINTETVHLEVDVA